jgi:peptidoglycan hydrolase-like protein with peptidoglycan-binding domain
MQYPGYIIKRGSKNVEAVKFVQSVVGATVDGIFGSGTERSVKSWQAANNLSADGLVGPATWAVMLDSTAKPADPEPVKVTRPSDPVAVTGDKGADIMNMVLVDRNEWDVTEPARAAKRGWHDITGIEIHYTGAAGPKSLAFADKKSWLLSIERYHEQTKGFSDIFYNMFVFADGEVWAGRTPLVQSQGSLYNWMTVHVPGTVGMELTEIQKSKIAAMADIVGGGLRGHGERAATGCPGQSALDFARSYRAGEYEPVAPIDWEAIALWVEAVKSAHPEWVRSEDGRWYGWDGEAVVEISPEQVAERAAAKAAKEAAAKAAAEAAAKLAAEEAARLEAERLAAEAKAAKAAEEAARIAAEEAAAEAAAEVARLEAEKAAAEEAARIAAEEAAAKAAEEAAAAAAEEAARLEAERLAAEAAALEAERAVETEEAEESCCEPIEDAEVGGLLRKILNWIFSIFKK